MMGRLIIAIGSGIISSLIANWITGAWTSFNTLSRWLVSAGIGVLVIAIIVTLSRQSETNNGRATSYTASGLRGKGNVRVNDVGVTTNMDEDTSVASDIKGKDIEISNVRLRRESSGSDARDKS